MLEYSVSWRLAEDERAAWSRARQLAEAINAIAEAASKVKEAKEKVCVADNDNIKPRPNINAEICNGLATIEELLETNFEEVYKKYKDALIEYVLLELAYKKLDESERGERP